MIIRDFWKISFTREYLNENWKDGWINFRLDCVIAYSLSEFRLRFLCRTQSR